MSNSPWEGEFLWEDAGRLQSGDVLLDPLRQASEVMGDETASVICVWDGTGRDLLEADDPAWIFRPTRPFPECEDCEAAAGQACDPDCLGLAALADAGERALRAVIVAGLQDAATWAYPDGDCSACDAVPADGFCDEHQADVARSRQYTLAQAAVALPYALTAAPRRARVDFDTAAMLDSLEVADGEVIGAPDDLPGLDEPWRLAEVALGGPSGTFCMYLIPYGARWLVCTTPREITDIEVFDDREAALTWIRYCIAHDMFLDPPEDKPGVWTIQRVYRDGVLEGVGVIQAAPAPGRFLVTGIISGRPFAEEAADAGHAVATLAAHLHHGGM